MLLAYDKFAIWYHYGVINTQVTALSEEESSRMAMEF